MIPKTIRKHMYTGKVQPISGERDPLTQEVLNPYLPNKELVDAVNLAIFLNRPLLLKGEPGCGKTRLAYAVAYELKYDIQAWYIKSTSRARDGLYVYDTVGRLRDAQLATIERSSKGIQKEANSPREYVRWGPVGRAFRSSKYNVLLIDEIDKADIDFPNDLLRELDQHHFEIDETGDKISAILPPLVIITSNDEKELPDAFLRRCLFFYLKFPDKERLIDIISSLFPRASTFLALKAIERFISLREDMESQKGDLGKKVSTSELVDWFKVLNALPEKDAIEKLQGSLPYPEILLKSYEDQMYIQ